LYRELYVSLHHPLHAESPFEGKTRRRSSSARRASRYASACFWSKNMFIEVLTLRSSHLFYQIVVVLEIALTLLIVWYALRWPKAE
jgi:hypothetical protein